MSKREATMFAAQGVDIDAPRAKRHKPGPATATASSPPKDDSIVLHAERAEVADDEGAKEDPAQVKERGSQLWQIIKDATNKEGRVLSHDFLRLPSKRQYPDYYIAIKRPIALDDIKRQLDSGQYAFFDEVKQDFEQCFKNAKKYNIKESQIWKDAKYLHKLVLKESEKMTGISQGGDVVDGDIDAAGSEAEGDEGKKRKSPNMYRLLKSRLQKLIAKSDDTGRVFAAEFMELPNRRQWPSYYKLIKRPQCIESIFKHLKRKEYETVSDFANDVELVFSNALEFNQEHTQIWDDAIVLRDYFRQLMSDLPVPFVMPAYASPDHSTKIKLRMPSNQHAPGTGSTSQASQLAGQSSRLHIPAHSAANATSTQPVDLPSHAPTPAPGGTGNAVPSTSAAVAAAQTVYSPQGGPNPQPSVYNSSSHNGTYSQHYPNAVYQSSITTAPVVTPLTGHHNRVSASTLLPSQLQPLDPSVLAKSPTPPNMQHRHLLRYASITTKPLGRSLHLDYRDGVRTWAVRLGKGELSVRIADVKLAKPGGDGEDSDDDAERGNQKGHERHEEEDDEEDEEVPQEKPRRGRGRPRKKVRAKTTESPKGKGKAAVYSSQPPEETQVRLNGVLLDPAETEKPAWDVDLLLGSNVLEIGEAGGPAWRLYLERLAYS